ncbi:hypothetical protein BZA77DRAFT_84293 [Pyronema omphalodes]|nr:hypothetical protein BZA77DRAFT_84293 [Pyronema omphalodes]
MQRSFLSQSGQGSSYSSAQTPSMSHGSSFSPPSSRNNTGKQQADGSVIELSSTERHSAIDSGNNSQDQGFCVIYTFEKEQLQELIKTHTSGGSDAAIALTKLLKRFGVQLVAIGIPSFNPVSKQVESELTLCSSDEKTLNAAMMKLSELGLPFKKSINNWYSGGRLPGVVSKEEDKAKEQYAPQEFFRAINQHQAESSGGKNSRMGQSFLDDDNDVFNDKRNRAYTDQRIPSNTSSMATSGTEASRDSDLIGPIISTGYHYDSKGKSSQQEQSTKNASMSPSKSQRIASQTLSIPMNSFETRHDEVSPTETTMSIDSWPKNDIYRVPQRRLSDVSHVPKLRPETSDDAASRRSEADYVTVPFPSSELMDHYKQLEAGLYHPSLPYGISQVGTLPKSSQAPWGGYVAESELSKSINVAQHGVPMNMGESSLYPPGYQRSRASTYQTTVSSISAVTQQTQMEPPVNPNQGSHPNNSGGYIPTNNPAPTRQQDPQDYLSNPAYRFQQAARSHNVRVQHPSAINKQENVHPRVPQPNYGGYGHYSGQIRHGYQPSMAPRPTAMHMRLEQPVQQSYFSDIYMGTGTTDGFSAYTLRPIPLTGPRFIR